MNLLVTISLGIFWTLEMIHRASYDAPDAALQRSLNLMGQALDHDLRWRVCYHLKFQVSARHLRLVEQRVIDRSLMMNLGAEKGGAKRLALNWKMALYSC